MADVVDFSSTPRAERLVRQCNWGSRSVRLRSGRAAACDACDARSAGVFGCWQIREMTFAESQLVARMSEAISGAS